jgi:DNA-binding GntR family transcriptional regulator
MSEELSVGDRLRKVFARQVDQGAVGNSAPLNLQVYQTIRETLLLGILAPGETLSYRGVAAALGVSPMPVREALGRLQMDGVLESLPNRAFRVPPTTASQFRELLLMRLRLETLAAEHAAIKVRPSQLLKLSTTFNALCSTERSQANLSGYLAAHRSFHFEIYKMAEMPRLYYAIETLWLRIGPLFREVSAIFDYGEENRFHEDAFRAMEICDPKAVVTAIENDLTSAGRRTMRLLQGNEVDRSVGE